MVVGTGAYLNTAEAFPLDRKTLNRIVWRSFMTGASFNGETGESIGWLWAMMPGLEKIHTEEQDLALSMGHNLEYVNTGAFLSTFAMGVTLSLEQQKADLETIRSVRTAAGAAADGIGNTLFKFVLIPMTLTWTVAMASAGNVLGILIYLLVLLAAVFLLRFGMMYYGYSKGTRAVESMARNKDALKHAATLAGIFMLGAMVVYYTNPVFPLFRIRETTFDAHHAAGMTGLLVTWAVYHLASKKNWSLTRCVLLILAISLLLGISGLLG